LEISLLGDGPENLRDGTNQMPKLQYKLQGLVLPVFTFIACLYLLLPLVIVVAFSLSTSHFVVFPPTGFTLTWYQQVLSSPEYMGSLFLSAKIAAQVIVIVFILGIPASIGLVRGTFPGRVWLTNLVMSPLVIPTVVFGFATLQFYPHFGLQGKPFAIVVGHSVWVLPVVVRYVTASLMSADLEKIELAASTLGASPVRVLFRITLPGIRASIVAAGLMVFALSFDETIIALFLATPDATPLPVRLFGQVMNNPGDTFVGAIGTVVLLISLGLVLVIEKFYGLERALIGQGVA